MKPGYSLIQIVLHWLVAALVLVQYQTGGSIGRTHDAVHAGLQPDPTDLLLHSVHNWSGMAIGVLMVLRLFLRWRSHGIVPVLRRESRASAAARLLHLAFYAVLLGQAAIGFIASYITFSIAPLHVFGANLILAMLVLHIGAAIIHAVMRDSVLIRILRPRG